MGRIPLSGGNALSRHRCNVPISARMDAGAAADSTRELAFLRAVIDHAHAGIVATDASGAIVLWNRVFERYHGRPRPGESADEWLGRCVHIEEDSVTPLAADDAPIARLLRGENVNGLEHAVICADGELRHRRAWGETIVAADGSVSGAVLAFHDVTQQRQAEEALRHHALHDSLTGLPNRTHLLDGLRTSISRARRTGRLIAVCMLDLDHIKLVNDTLGHLAGDLLLIAVAQRLSDAVRPGTPSRASAATSSPSSATRSRTRARRSSSRRICAPSSRTPFTCTAARYT